jgi:hypothetical protein
MIYFLYPETKHLELEDVDLLFNGEKVLLHLPPVSGVESRRNRASATRRVRMETDSESFAVLLLASRVFVIVIMARRYMDQQRMARYRLNPLMLKRRTYNTRNKKKRAVVANVERRRFQWIV